MKKTSVGIVGSGWVARMRHIPAFKRDERVEIAAIYSTDSTLAENVAKRFGIPHVYNDYALFLSQVDVVVICTPPPTHFELMKEALLAGKHVLSEKPFTMTREEGEEIERLAVTKGLVAMPSHNFLFGRAMRKARVALDDPRTGRVISALAIQWSSWKRNLPSWYETLPGGLFFDEGPHLMYLLREFIGDMQVTHASRIHQPIEGAKSFERVNAEFIGERGTGMLSAWFGAPSSEWAIIVACEHKTLVLDIFRDMCITMPAEKQRGPFDLMKIVARVDFQIWRAFAAWIIYRITKGSHLFGADRIARGFIDAVREQKTPPLSARDGYEVISLLRTIIDRGTHAPS